MLYYALQKASQHNSGGRQRLYAVATDHKGNVIAEAGNSYVTSHPLQYKYAVRAGRPEACFLHAEIHLLAKLAKSRKVCNTVFIARAKRDGSEGLAKPCPICAMALEAAGIVNIVYTGGDIEQE